MQDCARYVEEMTRLRREIHRRPEEGWTEFGPSGRSSVRLRRSAGRSAWVWT